jgi:hypothetical protein
MPIVRGAVGYLACAQASNERAASRLARAVAVHRATRPPPAPQRLGKECPDESAC